MRGEVCDGEGGTYTTWSRYSIDLSVRKSGVGFDSMTGVTSARSFFWTSGCVASSQSVFGDIVSVQVAQQINDWMMLSPRQDQMQSFRARHRGKSAARKKIVS